MLGRLAVSVWRFGEFFGVLVFLPMHGVILSSWGSVHLLAPHHMMGAAYMYITYSNVAKLILMRVSKI
jgi:hypothetical protein